MSSSAQYAITPKLGVSTVTTADTSRTAPTVVSYAMGAGLTGSRIDRINLAGIGATIASMVRLFLVPGFAGGAISSITFSGSTATLNTVLSHGLSTGAKVTVQGVLPFNYNVNDVVITVTGLSSFTYTMTTTPTVNAVVLGYFIYTTAAPTYSLLLEVPVTAVTPSASVAVYSANYSSSANPTLLPIVVPAGWSVRTTVNDTQPSSGVNVFLGAGDF